MSATTRKTGPPYPNPGATAPRHPTASCLALPCLPVRRPSSVPVRMLLLVFVAVFVIPTSVRGGLYNPCEPDEGPFIPEWINPTTKFGFRDTFLKYRSLSMPEVTRDNPMRRRYFLVQQLALPGTDKLDVLQKLSLSEYLIRRGDPLSAERILLPLTRKADGNFLVFCNMATACQQVGERIRSDRARKYQAAIDYMNIALSMWPKDWSEFTSEQHPKGTEMSRLLVNMQWTWEGPSSTFYRCRSGEEYFLKLLKSRYKEMLNKVSADKQVDALFTDGKNPGRAVRYVDEEGKFAPGKLAAAEKALLPDGSIDNAIEIVQQLLVWLPTDNRLYRQLGELYNARGTPKDLRAAREIFEELVTFGDDDLRKRRLVLNDLEIPADPGGVIQFNPLETQPKPADTSAPLNWNVLAVTFGFGLCVGLVGLWQVQEILRRSRRGKTV